jgi:hypothetical protein
VISPNWQASAPALFAPVHPGLRPITLSLLVLLVLPFASFGRAGMPPQRQNLESHYALIFGTVWGPDNRPVYGIKVKIRRTAEKKARWELYSDHRGEFAQRVPAGTADYVIWSDCRGCKAPDGKRYQAGPEVVVNVQSDERVDTGLHLK